MIQNRQQRNLMDCTKRRIIRTVWINSTGYFLLLCKIGIFYPIFLPSLHLSCHPKPYVEKIHYIDAELAGHVFQRDVKLQNLCGSGFSLFAVCCSHACQALPIWSDLTNNTLRKHR